MPSRGGRQALAFYVCGLQVTFESAGSGTGPENPALVRIRSN